MSSEPKRSSNIEPEHGIVRNKADDGWYVLAIASGKSPRPFFDVSYGKDSAASYAAAQAFNAKLRPYKVNIKNYRQPRSNKSHPELPIGK